MTVKFTFLNVKCAGKITTSETLVKPSVKLQTKKERLV